MQRHFLNLSSFLALGLIAALSSVACSSGSTATPPGSGGSQGSGTGGTVSGTGGAGTGGSDVTGSGGSGSGGQGSGGSGDASTDMGGGTGGAVTMGPACAPVTQVNQARLTLKKADISAYKYASPPADVMKMAYDPINKVVVVLTKGGQLLKFDPNVALPAATSTAVVTTLSATETSYNGSGDHRGLVYAADGTMYTLAATGGGGGSQNSVIIRRGVAATPGGPRTWTTVATSATYPFPVRGSNFNHSYSGLAIDPTGQNLYFSSGSRTDHGEDEEGNREMPLTSAIFTVPANGNNIMIPANGGTYMFADGTRNTYDLEFNANGDLIGGDNGPDLDSPDEVNWIQQGKHYGFPWRFGDQDNPVRMMGYTSAGDMRLHTSYQAFDIGSYAYDASFPAPPMGVTFTDPITNMGPDADSFRVGKTGAVQDASQMGVGLAGITGHHSPLGLSFDTKGALCGDYFKQGFMLDYGSLPAGGFGDLGNDLLFMQLQKGANGYVMHLTQIATGVKAPIDSVLVGNKLFTVGNGAGASVYLFVLPTPQ